MSDIRWLNNHIVDLTKTPWDKEKSDPAKGKFVFTGAKVYQKRGVDSPWKFGFFIRYSPPYRELSMMEATFGVTPVLASEALAYPEGLTPNAAGYYQFDDVILAKEPRERFLKRRAEAVADIDRGKKAEANKFLEESDSVGAKTDIFDA